MSQTFPLQQVSNTGLTFLYGIGVICIAIAAIIIIRRPQPDLAFYTGIAATLSVASLFFWFAYSQKNSYVQLSGSELFIRIPIYGRTLSMSDIVLTEINHIDDLASSAYKLKWRINGLGVPGYQLGWFTSAEKGRVLVSVTTGQVLVLPTINNYSVLLSVREVEPLIIALREYSPD